MSERDIVERLKPRISKEAREFIDENLESLEAMGEDEDDRLEMHAMQIVMGVYDAAPESAAEILRLRAELAAARDAAFEEAARYAELPVLHRDDHPLIFDMDQCEVIAAGIRAMKGPKP